MFRNHDISVPPGRKSGAHPDTHIRVYSLCAALFTVQELFITSPRVRTSYLSYYLRQTSPC